jgi:hypothetical protein
MNGRGDCILPWINVLVRYDSAIKESWSAMYLHIGNVFPEQSMAQHGAPFFDSATYKRETPR